MAAGLQELATAVTTVLDLFYEVLQVLHLYYVWLIVLWGYTIVDCWKAALAGVMGMGAESGEGVE